MATARAILDTRKARQEGTFPVKIRIAHVKDFIRIGTSISLSQPEFDKLIKGKNLNEKLKPIKLTIDSLIEKANEIIKNLEPFNFDAFKLRFTQKGNKADLLFLLTNKAEVLKSDDKLGNSNLYKQAATLLARYNSTSTKSGTLLISIIDSKWLHGFETWALKQKKTTKAGIEVFQYSKTTLSMYLIRVRAIFNDAITNKELNASLYPFHKADNKTGYKIPKSSKSKRALSIGEIMQIYNYETINEGERFAKDIFIFSYLSSGMNMIDVFRLKWSDIKNNQFTFVRKKTENKTGGANKITINLNQDLLDIIERHGTRKISNGYIFNVLIPNVSEAVMLQRVRSKIAGINILLKRIAGKLGLTDEISTYFARHSFATNQMNSEVPLAYISKQLGHSNMAITQDYLDSFTTEKSVEYQSNLLDKKVS